MLRSAGNARDQERQVSDELEEQGGGKAALTFFFAPGAAGAAAGGLDQVLIVCMKRSLFIVLHT